jgi:hypothetical protein
MNSRLLRKIACDETDAVQHIETLTIDCVTFIDTLVWNGCLEIIR